MTEAHPYPPFSGDDTECPKCGGDVGKNWQPANTKFLNQQMTMTAPGQLDWLLRECNDCDFRFPEMCADAPQLDTGADLRSP